MRAASGTIVLLALLIWNDAAAAPVRAAHRVIAPPATCTSVQPPILFIPALAMTAALYHSMLPHLASCRARVLIDLPGIGEAPPIDEVREDEILAALGRVLDAVSPSQPVVLVGSSLGGVLAARLAAAHPDRVSALVLIDAPVDDFRLTREERLLLHPSLWAPFYLLAGPPAMVRLGMRRFVLGPGRHPNDEVVDSLTTELGERTRRATLVDYYRRFLAPEAITTMRARLASLRMPVLLVWGEADRVVSRTVGEEALKALPPEARHELVVLAGVGHLPALEAPEEVARRIDRLVATLPPVAPAPPLTGAPATAPRAALRAPALREWMPLLGAQTLLSLDSRIDAGLHLGVARGGVDRRWPLESGRVVWTVGFGLHSDPINDLYWSFGYLRTTLAAELVWRWGGGLHLGGTLAVDPVPERSDRVGGWLEIGYLPSVIPWVKAFLAYGRFPQGDARVFFGFEVTARLTGLMY